MKKNKIFRFIFLLILFLFVTLNRKKIFSTFINLNNNIRIINFKLVNSKKIILDRINTYKSKINYVNNFSTKLKNENEMKIEMELLKSKIVELDNLKEENDNLRSNLKLVNKSKTEYIVGEVIHIDSLNKEDSIFINKGYDDGIESDLPVLYNSNLIGKIGNVSKNYSEVELISNTNFKISVLINSNISAILRGRGDLSFYINNFNVEGAEKIQRFNIKTSGISEKFPGNIIIGNFYKRDEKKLVENKELHIKLNFDYKDLDTVVVYKFDKSRHSLIREIKEKEGKK